MAVTFEDLQNGFYNALTTGLGMPAGSPFQLLQPSTPLVPGPQADPSLWAYFNNIPPFSLTQNFVASGGNQFFSDYRGLLGSLVGAPNTFQQDIGAEAFAAWIQFLPTVSPRPTASQLPQIFLNWAIVFFPAVATIGASDLAQISLDPVSSAQMAMLAYPAGSQADWTLGFSALQAQLAAAPSRAFNLSSSTMNSNVSNSWTQGSNSGFFGLWGGSSSTSTESSQFAASGVSLAASFAHILTFQASPGAWYSSSALNLAFSTQSGPPWKPSGQSTWQNTFGSSGNMQRFAVNLIVADTMNVQVTSLATFNQDQQQTIKNSSGAGLWPFYTQGGSSGSSTSVTFNQQGQMTVNITSQPGVPIVLGVSVLPVGQFVGHETLALEARAQLAKAA